jgi:GWxTD domain-containing protein
MNKTIFYIFILLFTVACGTSQKTSINEPNNTYKHDEKTIHPQFVVFNVTDSVSELHFKIATKELLYTRPDGVNFSTNVLISYRLFNSYDLKTITDSNSVRLLDVNNNNADKYLIGKINVKAFPTNNYYLRVTVLDINKNVDVTTVILINKESDLNRQCFLVKSKINDAPIFQNYVKSEDELTISYKLKIGVNAYVRYYNRDFPTAAPPFSAYESKPFQYKPDSTYVIELSPLGEMNFKATKKGFYHIQLDTTNQEGITLYNFSELFPEIKKAEDMIPPLRFITSKDEYDELTNSINKKVAIEKFWLSSTGDNDRAKEVIRKYYNRVQDANKNFTSYLEGWKTDRGMIYLIYGSPNSIYRSENYESWTYGESNNINSLQFSFSKVNNPFTDNDFLLDRSFAYKQSWYIAVDIWRQGRTYLQN